MNSALSGDMKDLVPCTDDISVATMQQIDADQFEPTWVKEHVVSAIQLAKNQHVTARIPWVLSCKELQTNKNQCNPATRPEHRSPSAGDVLAD